MQKKCSFYLQMAAGSDFLIRPDDEDSPEFKEYLRQLLKMQATRAKTGYSAPSSGSADAYVAKLTRLKIERNRRIQLGLDDDDLDYSYTADDYRSAKMEGQEPLISDTVLSVEQRQNRNKLRPLTADELRVAQDVETKLQNSLKSATISPKEKYTRPTNSNQNKDLEVEEAIDIMLNRKPQLVVEKASKPSKPANFESKAEIYKSIAKRNNNEEINSIPMKQPTLENKMSDRSEVKLSQSDTELIAKTLQSLVKHRYFIVGFIYLILCTHIYLEGVGHLELGD